MDYKKLLANYNTRERFNELVAENWYARLNRLKEARVNFADIAHDKREPVAHTVNRLYRLDKIIFTMAERMMTVAQIYQKVNMPLPRTPSFSKGGVCIVGEQGPEVMVNKHGVEIIKAELRTGAMRKEMYPFFIKPTDQA